MNRILSVVLFVMISAVPLGVNAQVQVKDINPGGDSSSPYLFYPLNGKFLFCADDGVHNHQLYVSDGTNAGTIMLTNFPYTTREFSSAPYVESAVKNGGFVDQGNNYYFLVNRTNSISDYVMELWKTDGTVSGTIQVDTLPKYIIGRGTMFVCKNNMLQDNICMMYTRLDTTGSHYELFRYNTVTGTSAVYPIRSNASGNYLKQQNTRSIEYPNIGQAFVSSSVGETGKPMVYGKNMYYLSHTDTLYSMDVDGNYTFMSVLPFHLIRDPATGYFIDEYVKFGDKILMYPNATTQSIGREPHIYDLTTNTCTLLKDINPYFNNSSRCGFFYPQYRTNPSKIYFAADDADHGTELWVTDGTSAGTQLLKDICPGTCPGIWFTTYRTYNFVENSNVLYFDADNPYPYTYVTYGTPGSTRSLTCTEPYNIGDSTSLFFTDYIWHDSIANVDLVLDNFNHTGTSTIGPTTWITRIKNDTARRLYNFNIFSCYLSWDNNGNATKVIKIGNTLYFKYTDCNTGYELYKLALGTGLSTETVEEVLTSSLFPNPTSGEINISGNAPAFIKVYNLLGQLVKTATNTNKIDITECYSGIYFVSALNEQGELINRFTVTKD